MSAYEELIERCEKIVTEGYDTGAFDSLGYDAATRAILAEVLRTLEIVTPEMARAHGEAEPNSRAEWLAALRASPLVPKTEGGGITIATLAMGDGSILKSDKETK